MFGALVVAIIFVFRYEAEVVDEDLDDEVTEAEDGLFTCRGDALNTDSPAFPCKQRIRIFGVMVV